MTGLFGRDWNSAVYETLHAAAREAPWDQSALDRVFDAYLGRANMVSVRR